MTTEAPARLTVADRAAALGLGYNAQLALERDEPWVASWAAFFDAGFARLRAWLHAGRPRADRGALLIAGDEAIAGAVRDVVAAIPEAVAQHLVASVLVRCGSAVDNMPDADGMCSEGLPGSEKPLEVCLLVADRGTIAHELAHAWHRVPSPFVDGLDVKQRERLRATLSAMAVDDGSDEKLIEEQMQRERAADALATAWMGFTVDTTSGGRGERRRRGLRQDLQRAAARAAPPIKIGPPGALASDLASSASPWGREEGVTFSTDDENKTTPEPAPAAGDTEPTAEGFVLGVGRCNDRNHVLKE